MNGCSTIMTTELSEVLALVLQYFLESECVLEWSGQDGLVVVLLLLLADDLQPQEELLLLQEAGVRRVHGRLAGLLLLVRGDVLVVLELLHPRLRLFALLTAALLRRRLLLALLQHNNNNDVWLEQQL